MRPNSDVIVVGGGILGLATARHLVLQRPGLRVMVLEKETGIARHQTGHNSGVIHSGIYYRPGSAKAMLCVRGRSLLLSYLEEKGIAHQLCGKLIVATRRTELPTLELLLKRAHANGITDCQRLSSAKLKELEPEVGGLAGLEVPGTGMVDYRQVSRAFGEDLEAHGGRIATRSPVEGLRLRKDGVRVKTPLGEVRGRFLVSCAGLEADRVARMAGLQPDVRIVPFRGEYYSLRPGSRVEIHRHIYPVPDPELPFLGVHLTLKMDGSVELGPNAVLALKREGYSRSDWSPRDVAGELGFPGFYRMAGHLWKSGLYEYFRSFSREQFAADLARLVPAITPKDMVRGGSGVRAQALSRDGRLLDDFSFLSEGRSLHVLNAPSPAATASLAIAEAIAGQVPFDLG